MGTNEFLLGIETSPPLPRHDAFGLFLVFQTSGYSPILEEQQDGSFIVYRGEAVWAHEPHRNAQEGIANRA